MEDEGRLALKERLLTHIEQTVTTIEGLKEMTKPISPENAIGRLTRMDAIATQGVNEEALRIAEMKLIRLQTAIQRIDGDPEFGYCDDCGNLISVKRLELMPEVVFCVKCAD